MFRGVYGFPNCQSKLQGRALIRLHQQSTACLVCCCLVWFWWCVFFSSASSYKLLMYVVGALSVFTAGHSVVLLLTPIQNTVGWKAHQENVFAYINLCCKPAICRIQKIFGVLEFPTLSNICQIKHSSDKVRAVLGLFQVPNELYLSVKNIVNSCYFHFASFCGTPRNCYNIS